MRTAVRAGLDTWFSSRLRLAKFSGKRDYGAHDGRDVTISMLISLPMTEKWMQHPAYEWPKLAAAWPTRISPSAGRGLGLYL